MNSKDAWNSKMEGRKEKDTGHQNMRKATA
jgi:hypothetical protein